MSSCQAKLRASAFGIAVASTDLLKPGGETQRRTGGPHRAGRAPADEARTGPRNGGTLIRTGSAGLGPHPRGGCSPAGLGCAWRLWEGCAGTYLSAGVCLAQPWPKGTLLLPPPPKRYPAALRNRHPTSCLGSPQPHVGAAALVPVPMPRAQLLFVLGGGAACQAGLEVEGRTGVTGLTCNSCLTEPGLSVQQGAPSPRAFISVSASKICDLSPPSQGEFCSIVCFQKQKLCNFQSRCVCGQLISISSCARLVLV